MRVHFSVGVFCDKRDGEDLKPILVHLAGSKADDVHIIGIRREYDD